MILALSVLPLYALSKETRSIILKSQVKIITSIPYRDSFYINRLGSGTVVGTGPDLTIEIGPTSRKRVYKTFYILTCPHLVGELNILLKNAREVGVKIYVVGNNQSRAQAEIIAWSWKAGLMMLKTLIPEDELSDYNIKPIEFAEKAPLSLEEERNSHGVATELWITGYPAGHFILGKAYISNYQENLRLPHGILPKTAILSVSGYSGQGQSGSGVFNTQGKLSGIIVAGNSRDQRMMIATPIDIVVVFLKKVAKIERGIIISPIPNFENENIIDFNQ